MFKNLKIAVKTGIIVTIVLGISFLGLWKAIDNRTEAMLDSIITSQIEDAVESRTQIINDYVNNAEEYLEAFALSSEVKNLLLHPDSEEYYQKAQQYTVDYAGIKGIFEGLYIAGTDTHVYTHTNEKIVGIQTREGSRLKEFQDTILAKKEFANLGILKSPNSGAMCISMYCPIYDGDTCIGFAGAAVYAENLMDSLLSLKLDSLPDSEYVFLNAETEEYLYNEDKELLCTQTTDAGYQKMLAAVKKNSSISTGVQEYTDENGVEQLVFYRNIPERNWVFAIRDTKAQIYQNLTDMQRTTAYLFVGIAFLVIAVILFIVSGIGCQLTIIRKAIERLGRMEISTGSEIQKFKTQKNEVGIICNSLDKTCNNLKDYIQEVDTLLSTMAHGDFTRQSNLEFAGDFLPLQQSLVLIQNALKHSFCEIHTVTEELVCGSQSVADSASNLANAAGNASMLVSEINQTISEISEQIASSTNSALLAQQETTDAANSVALSHRRMEELSNAMANISDATAAIENISSKMENISKNTNLLALNAMVEASRAGEAGKGFSVVANEIRLLAEQASEAAKSTYDLISSTLEQVNEGLRISEETTKCLNDVERQTSTIRDSVNLIVTAATTQNDKLSAISGRLDDISRTVETTAAMAQQSAAASSQLDGQTNVLRENISHYYV